MQHLPCRPRRVIVIVRSDRVEFLHKEFVDFSFLAECYAVNYVHNCTLILIALQCIDIVGKSKVKNVVNVKNFINVLYVKTCGGRNFCYFCGMGTRLEDLKEFNREHVKRLRDSGLQMVDLINAGMVLLKNMTTEEVSTLIQISNGQQPREHQRTAKEARLAQDLVARAQALEVKPSETKVGKSSKLG